MVRRLLQLNGLAIISVVFFHAAGMGYVAMFSWAHRHLPAGVSPSEQIGSLGYYYLRLVDQLVVFSIPAFLFVSGYFIAVATSKTREAPSWNLIWARLKALFIPFLIWSIVAFALTYITSGTLSLREILIGLVIGSANEAYYYVPLLAQFYLLSPLLVPFAKRNWKLLLFICAFIQLIVILLPYAVYLRLDIPNKEQLGSLVPRWFFPARMLWFPFGIVFGLNLSTFSDFVKRYKWPLVAIVLLCIPIGMLEWETFFRLSGLDWLPHRETLVDTIYSLAIILAFLAIQTPSYFGSRRLSELGVRSYGVYLIHTLVIIYTAKVVFAVLPWLLGQPFLLQLLLVTAGFGAPLVLMSLVDRSPLRRYYKYLFG